MYTTESISRGTRTFLTEVGNVEDPPCGTFKFLNNNDVLIRVFTVCFVFSTAVCVTCFTLTV